MKNLLGRSNYSSVCKRCGKPLTDEESRIRGFGPECYEKFREESRRPGQLNLFPQSEEENYYG